MYVGKVTKFQFNSFSHLGGAAFKIPEGGAASPSLIGVKISVQCVNSNRNSYY